MRIHIHAWYYLKSNISYPFRHGKKGCALFDIRGKVKLFTNEPLFLCADFIKLSMVGSNKQIPILHKINLLKDELTGGGGIIDPMYNKILWLPTNHSPLKEI